ncbi:MAG: hypothetical protein ABIA75_01345 [Candidatus Neomarinimicrobiota bacterium]
MLVATGLIFPAVSAAADQPNQRIIVEKFLDDQHNPPKLLGFSAYHDRTGRVCRIDLRVRRNRVTEDLFLGFAALADLAWKTRQSYKEFIVTLYFDQAGQPPQVWVATAEPTIECFIKKELALENWSSLSLYKREL